MVALLTPTPLSAEGRGAISLAVLKGASAWADRYGMIRVVRWVGVLVTLTALGALAAPASAATFTVTGTADGKGSCTGTTCTTLRAAIGAADPQPGSTVNLGSGRFT